MLQTFKDSLDPSYFFYQHPDNHFALAMGIDSNEIIYDFKYPQDQENLSLFKEVEKQVIGKDIHGIFKTIKLEQSSLREISFLIKLKYAVDNYLEADLQTTYKPNIVCPCEAIDSNELKQKVKAVMGDRKLFSKSTHCGALCDLCAKDVALEFQQYWKTRIIKSLEEFKFYSPLKIDKIDFEIASFDYSLIGIKFSDKKLDLESKETILNFLNSDLPFKFSSFENN